MHGLLTPVAVSQPDKTPSFLFTAFDSGKIFCLGPDGTLRWEYDAGAPVSSSVAVGNVDDDDAPEIIAAIPRLQTLMALSDKGVLK
ncbi:MAG: PQQ-like beta-propeller repeat protein, partial [Syntrophobacteraceae bacterium]|nr:PQQ-like beta-propeller repeat protein [Syntrophobacteraceae bacterium]